MTYKQKRTLKHCLQSTNWDYIETDTTPAGKDYRKNSGEWSGLCWLKCYFDWRKENQKKFPPFRAVINLLCHKGDNLTRRDADFISTLLPYC